MHQVRPASQQRGPPASLAPSVRGGFCMRLQESCSGKDCGAKAELTGNSSWSMGMGDICSGRTGIHAGGQGPASRPSPPPSHLPGESALMALSRRCFLSLPPRPVSLQTPPGAPAAARASPKRPGPHPAHSVPSTISRLPSYQAELNSTQQTDTQ